MIACDVPVNSYYEYVMPYRDDWGLIAQSKKNNRDGGDSSHRIGVFYYGLYLLYQNDETVIKQIYKDFKNDLNKIYIGEGIFIRHPDPNMWYSNPNNFTRDQTIPLIIALGAFNQEEDKEIVKKNLRNVVDNWSFFPNRLKNWTNEKKVFPYDYMDPAGPADYALYIRALKLKKWEWYLWFSDLFLLGNSFLRIGFSFFDNTDTSNDLNFTLHLLQAKFTYPTWWSYLAYRIYYKGRLNSPSTEESPSSSSGVQSAWNYYFRKSADGPPLNKIYQCIIDKEFSK